MLLVAVRAAALVTAAIQEFGQAERAGRRRHLGPAVLAVLIALPLLAIFLPLLMAADAIFADWVQQAFAFLRWDQLWWRLVLAGLFGAIAASLITAGIDRGTGSGVGLGLRASALTDPFTRHDRSSGTARILPASVTVLVLGILAVPFLIFLVAQLRYLFLPEDALGYSLAQLPYADYAREGFGQMLAVAILVTLLLYVADLVTRRESAAQDRWLGLAAGVLVACTLVILVSAFRRMMLYEEAHALTWLRLLAQSFIVVVGAGLLALLAALVTGRIQIFPAAVVVLAVGYLATLNVLNPEARIAASNFDHVSRYGKEFDRRNLLDLGPDAVPVMMARAGELAPRDQQAVLQLLEVQRRTLAGFGGIDDPRGWNQSRLQARDALEAWAPVTAAACLDLDAWRRVLAAYGFPGPRTAMPSEEQVRRFTARENRPGDVPAFCLQPGGAAPGSPG